MKNMGIVFRILRTVMVIRHCDVTFDEKSLYKDNFGGDLIERGWIQEE